MYLIILLFMTTEFYSFHGDVSVFLFVTHFVAIFPLWPNPVHYLAGRVCVLLL